MESMQPQTEPGKAEAVEGLVLLDGPDGVAVSMTPYAAEQTAFSLHAAAQKARQQLGGALVSGD